MASKVLQKPTIISIKGSVIRVAHPDISRNAKTRIASSFTAAATALTVVDNNGFADDDYLILGEPSHGTTEEVDVNGAVTRGTSITLTNSTKFSHEINAPVQKILERGIKIYRATTDGGTGTLLTSVDAITTPIADAVMIQWDKEYTEYNIPSTDTAGTYYFVKFTDATTDSDASDYILAAGLGNSSVEEMVQSALSEVNAEIDEAGGLITRERLLRWINDFQDEVAGFRDENGIHKDWDFEMYEDETSITSTTNQNKYSLDLTVDLKYPNTNQSIIGAKFGEDRLEKIDWEEMEELMDGNVRNTLSATATVGATSITLTDSYEFDESGTIYVGSNTVTYTANTETTGVLSGIPASGTGSITTEVASGGVVWQNITPETPSKFSAFRNYIYLDVPVKSTKAGRKIKLKYFRKLPRLTSMSSTTLITFPYLAKYYVGSRIEERKGSKENAERMMAMFRLKLGEEAQANKAITNEPEDYYSFSGGDSLV